VINGAYHAPLTTSPALSEEMWTFPISHPFQTAAIKKKETKKKKKRKPTPNPQQRIPRDNLIFLF